MNREDLVLKQVDGPNVLHIGCAGHQVRPQSPYWLHERLRERFPDVYGIDISEENIQKMRELGYKNLSCQDAERFQIEVLFDTIIAGELIEHLSNPGLFLHQAKYHLKPGGKLIITTPNPFSLLFTWYALYKFPRTCQNPEHTAWFCIETLQNLASRYNLETVAYFLVKDYRLDNPSWLYRLFARMILLFSPLLPKLWRSNTMVFVLQAK